MLLEYHTSVSSHHPHFLFSSSPQVSLTHCSRLTALAAVVPSPPSLISPHLSYPPTYPSATLFLPSPHLLVTSCVESPYFRRAVLVLFSFQERLSECDSVCVCVRVCVCVVNKPAAGSTRRLPRSVSKRTSESLEGI